MSTRRFFLQSTTGSLLASAATASVTPDLRRNSWTAHWIQPAGQDPNAFGVYHFRRSIQLAGAPRRFVVYVSGDNRYQLYVNGRRVVWGPARGDLSRWNFETMDLAPYLKQGRNVLAAVVWNYAQYAPVAQVTAQTAFLLQGETQAERIADTGREWKAVRNDAYEPIHYTHAQMRGYFVVGPGEKIDASRYPWGWETDSFDDSRWQPAESVGPASLRDVRGDANRWMLFERSIPLMEETPQRILRVRLSEGVETPRGFPEQPTPLEIPARTKAHLLLDQTYLTTGYPELTVSGGRGARVSLGYAESLYLPGGQRGRKGNRNEVAGKEFIGYRDVFMLDGGEHRMYRPLWWRTWRYLDVEIETADAPLTIEDLQGTYVGYPFQRRARFEAGSTALQRVLDVGWHTARLCAHETYMDCPYYEQLQYVGDTRIQALVSIFNSGDTRLMRNAIQQVDDTRLPDAICRSRAPGQQPQFIPSFSLWWIGMVHDYWMYTEDAEFVRGMLNGVRSVLGFFESLLKDDGSLGYIPWWRYMDWANEWPQGNAPTEENGSSAPFDILFLLALDYAAEMEAAIGWSAYAERFRGLAARLRQSIPALYWDGARRIYADTPAKKHYSQHSNTLAILTGLVKGDEAHRLMRVILEDNSLVKCSYYYQHYIHSALVPSGHGERYLDLLGPWYTMLDNGLTTWAERADYSTNASRSDCHAWSASPNVHLFRIVMGVDSMAPGFRKVRIRPHLGALRQLAGSVPHPRGEVRVELTRAPSSGLHASITLPRDTTGELLWNGLRYELKPGAQTVDAR